MGLAPDGVRFAFTAWQEGSAGAGNALFVVDGADGKAERVTDWTPGLWGVSWSPAGASIALTQVRAGARVASLIKPDGTGLRPVSATGDIEAFGPEWSPDGNAFLVRRGEQHSNDLWVMDLDGAFVWQVTHKPASYDVYAWARAADG
jgi:Tol biopolymer transport system component